MDRVGVAAQGADDHVVIGQGLLVSGAGAFIGQQCIQVNMRAGAITASAQFNGLDPHRVGFVEDFGEGQVLKYGCENADPHDDLLF